VDKVFFVGDIHAQSSQISSRRDDYPETVLSKIGQVHELACKHNVDAVVFAGDVFSSARVSWAYYHSIVGVFNKFKVSGIGAYSLAGNHDLPYDKIEYLPSSPLGALFQSGILKKLDIVGLPSGWRLQGVSVGESADRLDFAHPERTALFMHRFYESNLAKDGLLILKEDVLRWQFPVICLGHDHASYPVVEVGSTKLVRPGSLTRNTAAVHQKYRDVKIALLNLLPTYRVEVEEVPLDVAPLEEIWANSVFEEKQGAYAEKIGEFLQKAETITFEKNVSPIAILRALDIQQELKNFVEKLLREKGLGGLQDA